MRGLGALALVAVACAGTPVDDGSTEVTFHEYPSPDSWEPAQGPGTGAVAFTDDQLLEHCAYITGGEGDSEHYNLSVVHDGYLWSRVVQMFLSAMTVGFVADAARRLAGPVAGLAAGFLLALCWPAIYFAGELLLETFFIALVVPGLWCLLRAAAEDRPGWAWIGAALLGVASIVRPTVLVFLPALLFESACFGIDMGIFIKQLPQILLMGERMGNPPSPRRGDMLKNARLGGTPARRHGLLGWEARAKGLLSTPRRSHQANRLARRGGGVLMGCRSTPPLVCLLRREGVGLGLLRPDVRRDDAHAHRRHGCHKLG